MSFKICFNCFQRWGTVGDFLEDPVINILGYQVNFTDLEEGTLYFKHETCANILALCVSDFSQLRNGSAFIESKAGKDDCPGYCLYVKELGPCKNTCKCRWVRDVMQLIKGWKKM